MKSSKTYAEKKISRINVEETIKGQFESLIVSLKKELSKIKEINAVVLFGSFARGDYSIRHSDVDIMIFLDKEKKDTNLEERIRKKVVGLCIDKELSAHTLFQYKILEEEDKSLMRTIAKEGKVILSRKTLVISDEVLGLKEYFLVKFDSAGVKPIIKNKLQRFLYGYTMKGKKYKGIVDGEKVISAGKGAVIVHQDLIKRILLFVNGIGIKAVQKGKFYR